jgi:polyisoprenyl-teichoic acid--peptidoglycan teichoic acid transferase
MKLPLKSNHIFVVVILLAFLFILSTVQFIFISNKFEKESSILKKQMEVYIKESIQLENNLQLLNNSNNELRSILSLPELVLSENDQEEEKVPESFNENLQYYNAIDYLDQYYSRMNLEISFSGFLNSEIFKEYLNRKSYALIKKGSSKYEIVRSDSIYFEISAKNPEKPIVNIISTPSNRNEIPFNDILGDVSVLLNYLDSESSIVESFYKKLSILIDNFTSLFYDEDFNDFLKKEELEISSQQIQTDQSYYRIFNRDKSFILNISLDKSTLSLNIENDSFSSYANFFTSLFDVLRLADKRTEEIRVVDLAKKNLETIISQVAFILYLEKSDLTINPTPREDNDYFYYDLAEKSGNPRGSFAVQKIIGDVYLMDPEDIVISSIKYIQNLSEPADIPSIKIPENLPQLLEKYSSNDSTAFVVIGSHENNADTIILVNADNISKNITLIAIPRDLYFEGNKINDYYRTYGGEKFIEILSKMSGLNIDGYIAVDMYAFIDVINILGGIEITLETDLIDPTYVVRDNGEWGTLYYKKGIHHLNGIEALRISRSRHTSSDFGRTSRQQLVIKGIKDKLTNLDITDLGTVLKLFQTLDNYLLTNFSPMDMLGLFLEYKDGNLSRKQGLSTFNVLYNTYTNIYKLKDKSKQFEDGFYRGYWILLPKKDDWNVIKWYIHTLIEEKKS